MFRDLLQLLAPEIDAARAFEDTIAIQSLDRFFTYAAFHESARYTADRMRAAGLAAVEIPTAPADGKTVFGDWKMPLAWEAEAATFDLLLPGGESQRLADRAQVPQCLAMWSAPTPPEGVEADIVVVADAADPSTYPAEGVRGKIVFIGSHPHRAKQPLAAAGAAGILTDYLHSGADLPEAVAWINSFSDDPSGWAHHAGDSEIWSFQISPNSGARLRARLAAGEKLRGRAVVKTRLGVGTLPLITGLVQGTGKEEVVLIGHQFEGGAIDNASGVAAMLEAARAIESLIQQGKLARPERSIRLLFVSECYSNLYWWGTSQRGRRTVAGICLDSPVGAPEYAVRPMQIHVNQHAQMSYTDPLLVHLVEQTMAASPLYAWREADYSMTDNLISDTSIGVPCPWLGGHSRTWHTSADTDAMVPVKELGLTAQLTAAYAYLIASADGARALDFAQLTAAHGKQVLAAAGVAEAARVAAGGDLDDSMLQLSYLAERQAQAIESVLRLVSGEARASTRAGLRPLQREVRRVGKEEAAALARRAGQPGHVPPPHAADSELEHIHPRRLVMGPITFDRLPFDLRRKHSSPRWSAEVFSLLSWLDGKRSLAEAARLTAREHRRDHALSFDELAARLDANSPTLLAYFTFLREHGYVTW
jgi:hypothetical protein